ncbi:ATP-binding protein [Nocardia sp. NPDC056064]|uniref:ATP-binding protein n=1 Tax=Nocardia sp. NPDC056064 TaxID=3345701 RepID=UPI0035D55114
MTITEPLTAATVRARVDRIAATILWGIEISVAVVYLTQRTGIAGTGVHVALLLWALAGWWRGRWRPEWELGVVAAYLLCTPLLVDGPEFTHAASPMLAVAGTAVVSFAMARPLRWSAAATILVMAAWAIGASFVPGVESPWMIFSLDFLIVEWAATSALRALVLRAAALTDNAVSELAAARVETEVAEARAAAEAEQWATLHDTAASTLAMLGQGAVIGPDRLTEQLRRDLRAVERGTGLLSGGDLAGQLRHQAKWVLTPVLFTGRVTAPPDPEVQQAVVAAVGEALTNVDRHAEADSVVVELGDGHVRVRDDGIGFDIDDPAVLTGRYGVRHSIRRRLMRVGAEVEVSSRQGSGTTIDIRWGTRTAAPVRADADLALRLLRGYGYGLVLIAVLVTALQGHTALAAAHPVGQAAIIAGAMTATLLAFADIRFGLPEPVWWSTAIAVVVLGSLQGLLLDTADLSTSRNWAVAALGWQLAALSVTRGSRRGFVLLAVLWGAGLVTTAAGTGIWSSSLLYTVISVTVIQAVAIGFSDFLRFAVARTGQISAELTDLRIRTGANDAVQQDRRERYQRFSAGLLPLLRRLAEHPEIASDPTTRAHCLLESVRLRRLFGTDEPRGNLLLDELAPPVATAESRGVAVQMLVAGTIPELDPAERTRVLTVPIILLAGARTHARIVVTAAPAQSTLSITCDCDGAVCRAAESVAPDGTVVSVGESVWATVALT